MECVRNRSPASIQPGCQRLRQEVDHRAGAGLVHLPVDVDAALPGVARQHESKQTAGIVTLHDALDGEDRAASDEIMVTVMEESPLIQPGKLFSPDGNQYAPTWTIRNAEMLNGCEINVFDRQGQKLYASIGYATEWDGTYKGKPVPDGAYFYVIRCGGEITKSGSVSIARMK